MFLKKLENKEEKKPEINKTKLRVVAIYFIRYFELIITVLVLSIFVSSYVFLLKPKFETISELTGTYKQDKEAEKKILGDYLVKLRDYKYAYEAVGESEKIRVDKILPTNGVLEDFFMQIERLVSRQGLLLKSLNIIPVEDISGIEATNNKDLGKNTDLKADFPKEIRKVKLEMEVGAADYKSFKNLLTALEKNLHLMDVESVKFLPDGKEAVLSVVTYYLKAK